MTLADHAAIAPDPPGQTGNTGPHTRTQTTTEPAPGCNPEERQARTQ